MFSDCWDGLRGCDKCGNDTTGRLCRSCQEQEMIDNDDMADMFPEEVEQESEDDGDFPSMWELWDSGYDYDDL